MTATTHALSPPTTTKSKSWACTAARQVLPAVVAHERWLSRRRDGLGASEASVIAGINPWSNLTELYAEKVHGITKPDNAIMRVGRDLEGYVLSRFREATGLRTRRIGMLASREHPWMLASLDGLTDDGGLIEAKTTTSDHRGEWVDDYGLDTVPDHYLLQVQWQLKVSGRSHGWVACLFLDTREFIVRRVARDEDLINLLVALGHDFWHDHVLPQVAPPLDSGASPVMRRLHPAAEVPSREGGDPAAVALRRLERIKRQIKELKAEEENVLAELFSMTGSAEVLTVAGLDAATWRHTGKFNEDAWRAVTDPEVVRRYTTTREHVNWRAVVADRPEDMRFRGRVFLPKQSFA